MTKSLILGAAALGLCLAGCGKKTDAGAGTNAPPVALPAPGNPNEVVVAVGDAKLTRAQLDADVEKFIERQKAQIPPEKWAQITPEQLADARKALAERFREQFVTKTLLMKEAAKKGITVTDDEVKAHADVFVKAVNGRPGAPTSPEELLADAEFRNSVLVNKLVEQEISSKIAVDKDEVEKQYNSIVSNIVRRAKSPASEQVRASHILVKTGEGKSDEAAKKEIDALHAQLKGLSGEALAKKFAELAKEKSDCPSGAQGGDLGAFGHGQMVPEFDKAAFEQEIGKVYDPVKSSFGWHLILVNEKTPAKIPTEAEIAKVVETQKPKRADVERMMKNRQVQQKYQEYLQDLMQANGFGQPGLQMPSVPAKPVQVKE